MGGFISIIGITDGLLVKYLKSAQITCQMIYHNNFIILLVKNYDELTMLFLCPKYFSKLVSICCFNSHNLHWKICH